jgi:hypothetical protein
MAHSQNTVDRHFARSHFPLQQNLHQHWPDIRRLVSASARRQHQRQRK